MTWLRSSLVILVGVVLISMGWNLVDRAETAPAPRLRIEVLNGCGVDGLAARVARSLEARGQEVVRVGDAPRSDYPKTLLVDRRGRTLLTARLAERWGGLPLVLERRDGFDADASLILGADVEDLGLLTSRTSMLR